LTVDGNATFTTTDNTAQVALVSTDADASDGPILEMFRNSSSPADGDDLGLIKFFGENDASEKIEYGIIEVKAVDVSDGTEDGSINFTAMLNGTARSRLFSNSTETVFNEGSQDIDFRVESDGNANMLFVDAGNNRVGIGNGVPETTFHVTESTAGAMATFESSSTNSSGGPNIRLWRNSSSPESGDGLSRLVFQGMNSAAERIDYVEIQTSIEDVTDGTEDGLFRLETYVNGVSRNRLLINSAEAIFNDGGRDLDFRVESNDNANMLFVDAGNNKVGVGTNSPHVSLEVEASIADTTTGKASNSVFSVLNSNTTSTAASLAVFRSNQGDANRERAILEGGLEGSSGGYLAIFTRPSGSAISEKVRVTGEGGFSVYPRTGGHAVFNENSVDADFRVESDGNTHALFVDAGNNRVGILNGAPAFALDVGPVGASGGDGIQISAVRNATLRFLGTDTSIQADEVTGRLEFYTSDSNNAGVHAQILTLATNTAGSGEMQIWSGTAGSIAKNVMFRGDQTVFNEDSNDMDFRVESNSQANAFVVDGQYNSVTFGKAADGLNLAGGGFSNLQAGGHVYFHVTNTETNSSNSTMYVNRQSSDGQLIQFRQANSDEGNISVSGATVSYNGFAGRHESSGVASSTAKGTVVSTIDELDTYLSGPKQGQTRADHAKVKMSDTVGDARVYGVVDNFTDEGKVNVISVGIGSIKVTGACAGGDLLESNGDGTAKVQTDDIIRSKTIGKVTIGDSNTGVKLVSCVLYCG
jgi:hypothetical protein